ncbi:VOC family protein [Leifsonia aquatica]|uniref:VOC family protein n=1 Tax=Leifsonia aquatica TaxID=144185 RepID=UPI00046AD5EC|nr:VOC family protein [Leifsonia aquatica]
MSPDDRISPQVFHDAEGVAEWSVLFDGAVARYATGSFECGAALLAEIARLAEEAGHHPDVDLRYGTLVVRLVSHDVGDISRRDQALAARISTAAQRLGIEAAPQGAQAVQISIHALDIPTVLPFWQAALAYDRRGEADLVDPLGRGPAIAFQPLDHPMTHRNRIHLDISVPRAAAAARVDAVVAAGGRLTGDSRDPLWWSLADPEGNVADIAAWRDDSEEEDL